MRWSFLLFLTLASCNSGVTTLSSPQIMPLAVGNRWIGRITEIDSSANIVSVRLDTQVIYRSEVVNGETWYYKTETPLMIVSKPGMPDSLDTLEAVCTIRTDGLYSAIAPNFSTATLTAKYPAAIGDTLFRLLLGNTDSTETWDAKTVVSTDANLSVPAGSFICFQYNENLIRIKNGIATSHPVDSVYYAPGVGLLQYGYDIVKPAYPPRVTHHHALWQLVRAELH